MSKESDDEDISAEYGRTASKLLFRSFNYGQCTFFVLLIFDTFLTGFFCALQNTEKNAKISSKIRVKSKRIIWLELPHLQV